jgi:glucose/arabinose dehydrogenase
MLERLRGTIMTNGKRIITGVLIGFAASGVIDGDLRAQSGPFATTEVADFEEPWAMTFLPDGPLLVTEKAGALKVLGIDDGTVRDISGVPEVAYGGQGGFGDVVLHPGFTDNGLVYLSYGEPGEERMSGAAVARARLVLGDDGGELADLEVIWRQSPKVRGGGHYGQRIAFGHGYLWISAGERQQGQPAQDMSQTLGKIIRLNYDGTVPNDNPFFERGGVTAEIWSLGHRNPLGLAFDASGQLWNVEMGPQGGDELNRVERGANYGWPTVSNGVNYGGGPIPDHDTRPEFNPPAVYWVPSISPSSLMFYGGDAFPEWRGDAFIGGLSSQSIRRIEFDGDGAREAEYFEMGTRIRALAQGPDGAIWVLEDEGGRGGQGRLLKLTPND